MKLCAQYLIAISLVAAPLASTSAVTVGGLISSNTQWTAGTYVVTSNIVVLDSAKLTIDPGVTLQFEPNAALIVSDGSLVARGTAGSPIVFTGTSPWGFVGFGDDAADAVFGLADEYLSGSILEYVTIENAGTG